MALNLLTNMEIDHTEEPDVTTAATRTCTTSTTRPTSHDLDQMHTTSTGNIAKKPQLHGNQAPSFEHRTPGQSVG
jgi:hypothetical protein